MADASLRVSAAVRCVDCRKLGLVHRERYYANHCQSLSSSTFAGRHDCHLETGNSYSIDMALRPGEGAPPINPEEADNFEEIEKQFAVKGKLASQTRVLGEAY